MNNNNVEIERKFLLNKLPMNIEVIKDMEVEQSYVSVNPEVRIRKAKYSNGVTDYILCIKSDGELVRTEVEMEITKDKYEALKKIVDAKPLHKFYFVYKLEDNTKLEVSLVNNDIITAEVEFKTIEDAYNWKPTQDIKPYIIKEVTNDSRYKMKNYWASRQNTNENIRKQRINIRKLHKKA